MMILKSDEKNMVQKYIYIFFLQYIHHFIQFKLHEKQNKKKKIYTLYLSELSQQTDRILNYLISNKTVPCIISYNRKL